MGLILVPVADDHVKWADFYLGLFFRLNFTGHLT